MATTQALAASLKRLRSSDVNLAMLHWPECRDELEWMDCSDAVAGGTWIDSWRALQRAYAEGRALAIGVSNFDINELERLLGMAAVRPHVVQNWYARTIWRARG